MYPAAVVSTVA